MFSLLIVIVIVSAQLLYWNRAKRAHQRRIDQLGIRVHVNGIRGKSTVTRLIAGVLRAGGYNTFAKTTGSAARIIHPDGSEDPIHRYGAATILEQINIVKAHVTPNTEAMVMECMAVNPAYQHVAQHEIVQGNITVITNVREDHQAQMGETLPEIAHALATTIPRNGLLITAESRPELRQLLADLAAENGSRFVYADPAWVSDADIAGFDYLSFKDNVAIGLAVAGILGVPRAEAMVGMQAAQPDAGAVTVQRERLGHKELLWAPLFAVNDRESAIINVETLRTFHAPDATRIGILNNREDRPVRAAQFARIAALDLQLDYYLTFGAYENQVTAEMVKHGFPHERIIHMGFRVNPTLDDILAAIANCIEGQQGILIGLVNIHTPQAELLLHYFDEQTNSHPTPILQPIAQPA